MKNILIEISKGKPLGMPKKILSNKVLHQYLIDNSSFLSNPTTLERLYCVLNNIKEVPLCTYCKEKPVTFKPGLKGPRKYCSNACVNKSLKGKKGKIRAEKANITKNIPNEEGITPLQINTKNRLKTLSQVNKEGKTGFKKLGEKTKRTMKNTIIDGKNLYQINGKNHSTLIKNQKEQYGISCIGIAKRLRDKPNKISLFDMYKKNLLKDDITVLLSSNEYVANYNTQTLIDYKCNICNYKDSAYLENIFCKNCHPSQSKQQILISKFLQEFYDKRIINNCRTILDSKKEIDIFLPDINTGIEYNGVLYHSYGKSSSEKLNNYLMEDKFYHVNKTKECLEKNITLYHIFENEWLDSRKKDIWKSILLNKIIKISETIYARKCTINIVENNEASIFLELNHLQGKINGKHIGLYYKNELMSIMTFGKSRFNKKYDWELLRFCNKKYHNVVGGASRLLAYFKKTKSGTIISYSDLKISNGNLYKKLGFEYMGNTPPNYFYIKLPDLTFHSRLEFQKHKLQTKLKIYDENVSEFHNMIKNNYRRIWDCGNQIWCIN